MESGVPLAKTRIGVRYAVQVAAWHKRRGCTMVVGAQNTRHVAFGIILGKAHGQHARSGQSLQVLTAEPERIDFWGH